MGIALWLVAGSTACLLAGVFRKLRQRLPGEFLVALVSALLLGAVATALDFGGWRELDWRAGLFVLFGSFSAVGFYRTIRGDPMKRIATAVFALLLFSTCAAYQAQH